MHNYGDEGVNFDEIDEAGWFIGRWLRNWVRLPVMQIKEKFGTVRVYCHFGWSCFYSIWRPSHHWISSWWPYRFDLWISDFIMPLLNKVVVPIQMKAYRWRYKKAVEKWPHLAEEILICADYPQLLYGICNTSKWLTETEEL